MISTARSIDASSTIRGGASRSRSKKFQFQFQFQFQFRFQKNRDSSRRPE
jgi:hypothetical protein